MTPKLSYCRSISMHKYRHSKLPASVSGIFAETSMTDEMQSIHNDYNYLNQPAMKRYLDKFSLKKIIFNWNALSIDLKSTAEFTEFEYLIKESYLAKYNLETDCFVDHCFSYSAD